jgi:hypothetical protein
MRDPINHTVIGYLNNGRTWTAYESSPAYNRTDLLTICIHELGPSLGMDVNNTLFISQLGSRKREQSSPNFSGPMALTLPRPFAPMPSFFFFNTGPHLDSNIQPDRQPVLEQFSQPGVRQLVSGIDALAIAQIALIDVPVLVQCEDKE